MATKVFMEALSPTMEEGRLVKWLKNEGDAVKTGDVLAEVETDKAVMELTARGDGVLRKRLVEEGATTPVGQLLGVIATADENIDAVVSGGSAAGTASAPSADGSRPSSNTTTEPAQRSSAQPAAAGSQPRAERREPIAAATQVSFKGTKVSMEALSPTMEEGRLVKWLKNEGDQVKSGDVLAEVETDKAVMELVARGDGVLRKRLLEEGNTAPVGQLLGIIAAADADISGALAGGEASRSTVGSQPSAGEAHTETLAAPTAQRSAQPPSQQAAAQSPNGGRVRSSPLARRLASERGLNLGQLQGSGPGGRIIRRDVDAAGQAPVEPTAQASSAAPPPRAESREPGADDFKDIPLTQIRKTIAKRLAESIGPIPTFYLTAEFDLGRVAELRDSMTKLGDDFKVSFNDIILKAVATALAQHPEVNAHWLGDRIRFHNRVHLGMAVATDEGLIVPVIFDADRKRMSEISREARELAKLARDRKLKPEQYTGSTFSVSNLGMFGIDQFTAIINPPEAGILAIGAAEDKAVVVNGAIEVRKRLRLTMSCDHRVIDGAVGAKFLQTLRRMIENPLMLVY
jgi:pyruvate dehydrogenase E2 component (dihydrolipoamide acetyltransferase)